MGTTRVKVIDLASSETEIKAPKKRPEKIVTAAETKDVLEEIKSQPQTDDTNASAPEKITNTQITDDKKTEQKTKNKTIKSSTHHNGKNYTKAKNLIEDKTYTLTEALEILPKTSFTKFDPSVEAHLTVSDKNLKGTVSFPHLKTEKKENKYLIFTDKKSETDKKVIWADEKTVEEIENGTLKPGKDFDMVVATPKFMPSLAKIAKILGPKGLMPNPKNGTVTDNIEKFLKDSDTKATSTFKTDPTSPVVHSKIGKLSQNSDELKSNFKALITAIGQSKIKRITITTTMGPGIKVSINPESAPV